ncbi:Uncharacterised protein [Legionella steigerwaltii]|uniref:Uncharacterized protein n=1 Tax=Legionella steigerwaltii TaxID=460 RepID=A0A378LFP1_9GAMM|nr:hypothetical protein [Legionella steigerwaltii]KTD79526.1 hypothetical protein Lstg_0742 [Legionella steigerwaltii]STY24589.1 Uncharacterised protein [Legionella steigerwaltii]
MRWMNGFWTAANWAFDTTVHAAANTMNVCGTLACTLGGAAYAVSNMLNLEEVSASYYGAVNATGNFTLGVNLTNLDYGLSESFPLTYSNHVNNGTSYNLTDYITSGVVQNAGVICMATGIALRTVGATINEWQKAREEQRYYADKLGLQLAKPLWKEYGYVSAEAFAGAVALAMFSTTVATTALQFSSRTVPKITYPPSSEHLVSGAYYNGPTITLPFNIRIDLGTSNFTIPLYFENLNVLLNKTVDVAAKATYGGGFFFKPNKATPNPPLAVTEAVSAVVGGSAYLAQGLFAKKAEALHAQRIQKAEPTVYTLVNS